jgi:hypothetical protein
MERVQNASYVRSCLNPFPLNKTDQPESIVPNKISTSTGSETPACITVTVTDLTLFRNPMYVLQQDGNNDYQLMH